jgi:hypothetical protein
MTTDLTVKIAVLIPLDMIALPLKRTLIEVPCITGTASESPRDVDDGAVCTAILVFRVRELESGSVKQILLAQREKQAAVGSKGVPCQQHSIWIPEKMESGYELMGSE